MAQVMNYKDLIVWQKGMELAELIYSITSRYPSLEMYSLVNQMRRAAVSVVSNIAEGKGRDSKLEYLHFLSIARGSVTELETQLLLSIRLKYIDQAAAEPSLALCDEISRMLNSMRSKIKAAP